MSSIVIGN